MLHLFQILIYQPFFNLLIGLYWILNKIPNFDANMGVAVIIFTIIIRILLLPISLAANKQEKTRKQIEQELHDLSAKYSQDPVSYRKEFKKTFRRNRGIVIAELISLAIQVMVALILWRIFATGLQGADEHLVYPWMPKIFPIPDDKLMFMGFSLWEPHWQLNILQSVLIFIVETLSIYVSPYPITKGEVVRLQLVLPLISFIVFSQLPAGKKLFVIVTLLFSLALIIGRAISLKLQEIRDRIEQKEEMAKSQQEQVLVDVKA